MPCECETVMPHLHHLAQMIDVKMGILKAWKHCVAIQINDLVVRDRLWTVSYLGIHEVRMRTCADVRNLA